MSTPKYIKIALALTLAGACFSGYLSATKLLSGSCAFNESCPVFFGYPACYYGFAVFLAMLAGTFMAYLRRLKEEEWPLNYNLVLSAVGILFSGSFVLQEVAVWFRYGFRATFLGLSTCAYGLLFYVMIFAYTAYAKRHEELPGMKSHTVGEKDRRGSGDE